MHISIIKKIKLYQQERNEHEIQYPVQSQQNNHNSIMFSPSPSLEDLTKNTLIEALKGGYDAGLLVEEEEGEEEEESATAATATATAASGRILFGNDVSADLFFKQLQEGEDDGDNQTSITTLFQNQNLTMDSLVSFWSFSIQEPEKEEDETDDKKEDDNISDDGYSPTDKKKKGKKQEVTDELNWSQVLKYATRPKDPVLDWIVTGKVQDDISSSTTTATTATSMDQDESKRIRKQETFPGVMKLSRIASAGSTDRFFWLVTIRHADQHDIITAGQHHHYYSPSDGHSGTTRNSNVKRGSSNPNRNKIPSVTVDSQGYVRDISDSALELARVQRKRNDTNETIHPTIVADDTNNNNSTSRREWSWITTDLIGQHISTAPILAKPPPPPPPLLVDNVKDTSKQQQCTKKPFRMLDMILESGMELGHPSQPMSGFPLQLNTDNGDNDCALSAMSTAGGGGGGGGGAAQQRDENITQAAFEVALDPIFQINEHGTIQMVNSAATKTFGWRRSEFLGQNIAMICGGVHGNAGRHASYMARYLATGDTRVMGKNRELVARRKDGTDFPIELGVVEVDTFAGEVRLFCGFVRDLTHIKARERLAQEMVEAALDPMFQINGTGSILMVNQAALHTFGYNKEELIGHNISMICGGSHGHNHELYLKKYLQTGEKRVIGKYRELPAKRKDGSEFPIQLGTYLW